MDGHTKLLQLPDQEEQAGVQHQTQSPEGPQLLLLQQADSPQDGEHGAGSQWQRRVVVVMKQRSGQQKPATSYVWTIINKNTWATLNTIQHIIHKNKYCLYLCTGTASAIPAELTAPRAPQQPLPPKQ